MKFINTTKLIGLLALLVFLYPSCKDDDVCTTPSFKCEDFPERQGGGIFGPIIQKPNQRKSPCFNPNNPNEFIYINIINNKQSIVKRNLASAVEEILVTDVSIITPPDWGLNNKIVYVDRNYQLYTIDLNNSNAISQHTFQYYQLYPRWLNDSIIVCQYSFNLGRPYFRMSLNINNNEFDTLRDQTFNLGDVSIEEKLAFLEYGGDPNILIYNGTESIKLSADELTGPNSIVGLSWIDANSVVYSTYRTGVFTINTDNKAKKCIKSSCDTRSYRHLSVSANGDKLLAERVDATDYRPDDAGWTEESKIVIMNIDGSDEKVLFE